MANPRSLVYSLYTNWDIVESLARLSREFTVLNCDQVLSAIAKTTPQLDIDDQGAILRSLVSSDILQIVARSDDLQLNAYVLDFVRGLTREHELGLAAVLQARVLAIREATEALKEGMLTAEIDKVREAAKKLADLFRQISLQLDQDRHAILELAEEAKSADAIMPITQRYRRVLDAYDQYVEPMNQMMDTGPQGTFYRYLEEAERALDLAFERLSVQGGLFSHRQQLRQVTHQAKELRRFGRLIAQQCADTVLPLREEIRQHNTLTSAISRLLGQVRKRGLRRALYRHETESILPLWRNERGFRLQIGDEIRSIFAAARQYEPQSVVFPIDEPDSDVMILERVDEVGIREHLLRSLPVESLLDWLKTHYGHFQDPTLLRLFYELQLDISWHIKVSEQSEKTNLQTIRVLHYPHRVSFLE